MVTLFKRNIQATTSDALGQRGSKLWELIEHDIEKIGSLYSYSKWEGVKVEGWERKGDNDLFSVKATSQKSWGSVWSLSKGEKPSAVVRVQNSK